MARLGTIAQAVAALRSGGLAVLPTETLWGLGARADDPAATAQILAAKLRPADVPLQCAYPSWASAAADVDVTPGAQALADRFLPGPVSLVLARRNEGLAHLAPGRATLSVRVPANATAQRILRACGPLALSSANRHGEPDARTADDVLAALQSIDAIVVPGEVAGTGSTVVDCTGPLPKVLREGVIPASAVAAAWPSSSPTSPSRTG